MTSLSSDTDGPPFVAVANGSRLSHLSRRSLQQADDEQCEIATPDSSNNRSSTRHSSGASRARTPIAFDPTFDFLSCNDPTPDAFSSDHRHGHHAAHQRHHHHHHHHGYTNHDQQQQQQQQHIDERMRRLSVFHIAIGAIVGVAIGFVLDNVLSKSSNVIVSKWLVFISSSYKCAMNCLMVPMVFINIVLGIVNLFGSGNAGRIGWQLMASVSFCSLVASSIGILTGLLFEPLFSVSESNALRTPPVATLQFMCPNGNPLVLESNGTLHCRTHSTAYSQSKHPNATLLELDDLSSSFVKNSDTPAGELVDLSDHLFFVLEELFPTNVVVGFRGCKLPGFLVFAIAFGVALSRTTAVRNLAQRTQNKPQSTLLVLLFQVEKILSYVLSLLMAFLPLGMVFLVSTSLMENSYQKQGNYLSHTRHTSEHAQKYGASWQDALVFIGALTTGLTVHCLGFMGLWTFAVTRANVLRFLRHLVPAQVFAFACSSSIVSLPLTITSVLQSQQVSFSLTHFVCCLGATVNKNGSAVFLSLATMYMAQASNALSTTADPGSSNGWLPLVFLAVLSSFFSIACAPIPHASLMFLPVIWHACFGQLPLPMCFHMIVAIDYVSNRMVTVVNITNDSLVAWMIAKRLR